MNVLVCTTGQHRELLDGVMEHFGITADVRLDLMREAQSLADISVAVLESFSKIIVRERPDAVMVHGDTTTAFAVSIACFYSRVPIYHVEAGLRTGEVRSPFPEEFNRRAISILADLNFAPTQRAAENLLCEGVAASRIVVTGNTVLDALRYTVKVEYSHPLLEKYKGKRIVLFTAHRRESHGRRMEGMLMAAKRIVQRHGDVCIIYPVHPSPSVRETALRVLYGCERIELCEPFDVLDCHNVMARSYAVLTDSGGMQEEAIALGIPVFIMRDTTERPEGILSGGARLAGTDEEQILATVSRVLDDDEAHRRMCYAVNPYGDGNAAQKIADAL